MTRNEAVEKHRQLILDTERYIWKHPETGYKELLPSGCPVLLTHHYQGTDF